MVDSRPLYGTTTTITATGIATLANATSVVSATVDNTTDLFLDALVEVTATTGAGAGATGFVEIYIKGSIDNTDFDDDNNDKWVGTIAMVTGGASARKRVVSVASGFSGVMPAYWQVRVRNVTGAAFTAGALSYRGVRTQIA